MCGNIITTGRDCRSASWIKNTILDHDLVLFNLFRKRVSLIHSLPIRKYQASDERLSNETQANSDFRNFSPMQKCDISSSGFPKTAHNFNAPIELAEHPTPSGKPRHVYSNPNYPAMEIGGLPFFLMPSSSDRDTVLTTSNLHRDGFNDHDYVSTASQRSGPIYEDIDRMCTYRGAPPDLGVDKHSVSPKMSGDRTYYNVPASSKFGNRPDSSGASSSSPHQQCGTGTSSSEVSFESGSSPRHPVQRQNVASSPLHQGHVIVNPVNSRNRTFSPNSSYSARMTQQSRASPSSSVYYYSDTLRPRQNRALAVDSDSGISNVQDTPPPPPPGTTLPPLPSQRFVTKDIKDPKISSSKNRSESSIVSPQSLGFSGESKKTRRKGSSAVKVWWSYQSEWYSCWVERLTHTEWPSTDVEHKLVWKKKFFKYLLP